ncbi:MAG: efflux RND transporter periplasmic adaptor subunit [Pedobacter sp.]|nr:MAG: efflux RND transporter periplasmic adaptor subunit [Pedobacter sp.]
MKATQFLIYPLLLLILASSCGENIKQNEKDHPEQHESEAHDHSEVEHVEENPTQVELTPEQEKLAEIKVSPIQSRVLGDVLRVNGIIDVPPDNLVSISTSYGGKIKSTEMLEGSKVKKGQVLAVIENPDFILIQQQYLEAKSQLEFLKAEFERKELLYKEEVASQKSYQAAKAEYQSQAVRVNALAEQLKLIGYVPSQIRLGNIKSTVPIRSTIDGFVKSINVNVGKSIQPMEVLFELVDPRHQHVELTVYQQDANKIQPGQKVLFSISGENKMERTATVYLVGKAIDEEKSIKIHAHPDDEDDSALRAGAYVQALIETGSTSVPSVPDQAVVEFEEQHYVFIRSNSTQKPKSNYKMVPVKKGVSEGGFTEIHLIDKIGSDSIQVVSEGAYSLLGKLKNTEEEGEGHAH